MLNGYNIISKLNACLSVISLCGEFLNGRWSYRKVV